MWCAIRINPNHPTSRPPLYLPSPNPNGFGPHWPHGPQSESLFGGSLSRVLMRVRPDSGSRSGFLRGNRPTMVYAVHFLFLFSL
jgi:hypothetical protein